MWLSWSSRCDVKEWGRLWFGAHAAYEEGGWYVRCCPWENGWLKAAVDILERICVMATKMRKGLGASPVMKLRELALCEPNSCQ